MPLQPVRTLHIITNLAIGGAQDNMLMTLERLDREKYEVELISGVEGPWLERAKNIKNLHLMLMGSFTRNINFAKDFWTLWRIYSKLKKGKYIIVHTHTSKAGFLGRVAAKSAGVPIIIHTMHGINFNECINPVLRYIFLTIERIASRLSNKLVTVSLSNQAKFVDARVASLDKLVNIYNGIDFDRLDVGVDVKVKRREIGIEGNEKIVGTVGRLFAEKAPQDLIRAIPKVLAARSDIVFVFIGDGELLQELQFLSKRLGVERYVKFLGSRNDVPELLPIIDVFVLTSLSEGMPRSLAEAMYCARPVVATEAGGIPELVKDGETGILVKPRDTEGVSRGIVSLLNDQALAQRLGEAAKKHVADSFCIEKMITEIENLYDKLLHEKGLDGKVDSNVLSKQARANFPSTY